jgi:hypothetical protein
MGGTRPGSEVDDRKNVPLPKGNTYFSRVTSSLVYSCLSAVVYPLLPSRQSVPSPATWVENVRLLGTVLSRGSCLGDFSPQPRVRGFVPHDPVV